MAPVQPEPGTEVDLTRFENRYPTLPELLRDGGLTGVEYCLVSGANQRLFAEDTDENGKAWSPVRDLPALTVAGPKGTVDTVILMGRGDPIRGSGDFNGIRQYFVDVDLEEAVGIAASKKSPLHPDYKPPKKEGESGAPQKGKE
jgi:hypothetical protein